MWGTMRSSRGKGPPREPLYTVGFGRVSSMKKAVVALGTSLFVSVAMALPALADSSVPRPHDPGTAFTGANMSPFLVAFVVLAVVGVSALALYRRRAVAS